MLSSRSKTSGGTLTSWQGDYTSVRPHSALGMLTPRELADSVRGMQAVDAPNSSQLKRHQDRVKTGRPVGVISCSVQ
jgi:hypothetical protein